MADAIGAELVDQLATKADLEATRAALRGDVEATRLGLDGKIGRREVGPGLTA